MILMATVSPLKLVNKMAPAVKGIIKHRSWGSSFSVSPFQTSDVTLVVIMPSTRVMLHRVVQEKQIDNVKVATATGII